MICERVSKVLLKSNTIPCTPVIHQASQATSLVRPYVPFGNSSWLLLITFISFRCLKKDSRIICFTGMQVKLNLQFLRSSFFLFVKTEMTFISSIPQEALPIAITFQRLSGKAISQLPQLSWLHPIRSHGPVCAQFPQMFPNLTPLC